MLLRIADEENTRPTLVRNSRQGVEVLGRKHPRLVDEEQPLCRLILQRFADEEGIRPVVALLGGESETR